MELPAARQPLLALAEFVVGLLRAPCDDGARPGPVIVAAPAPFAVNGYARARLLRQLYATGALFPDPDDTLETAG